MAGTSSISLDIAKFEKQLKKEYNDVLKVVDAEMQAAMVSAVGEAVRMVPVDNGFLKNSIDQKRNGFLDYALIAVRTYAAYVEFGTGTKVNVPLGYESYAKQFQGTKKIAGQRAQPYLIPAAQFALREIEKRFS